MRITVSKALFERNPKLFFVVGLREQDFRWNEKMKANLDHVARADLEGFRDGIKEMLADGAKKKQKPMGLPAMLTDVNSWLTVLSGGHTTKPRSVEQFASLLTEIIRSTPHKWITVSSHGVNHHWYVEEVEYHREVKRDRYIEPAHADVDLVGFECGAYVRTSRTFYAADIMGRNVIEALAGKSMYLETPESFEHYLRDQADFEEHLGKTGRLMLAINEATDNADGNPASRKSSWYWRQTNTYKMDFPEPSRVLIDVFHEDEKTESGSTRHDKGNKPPSNLFWARAAKKKALKKALNKSIDEDDDGEDEDESGEEEIPWTTEEAKEAVLLAFVPTIHHLIVFCLRRHLRLRIHVRNLERYQYDTELGRRLVIPDDVRDLIDILLTSKSDESVLAFKDIIGSKGGGAVILSAGSPGTGKTLTAEVYSEVMERPLYTVQASQLGVDADELEEELLKVFARSQRWGAILLIDEADVYVAARGSDLIQNAIVGVFLRTLEYYQGVLFLTTNRSDLVDDAIASRCIARFDYKTPSREDQARLWAILAETAGISIKDNTIQKIVEKHPNLSGRDIKNLLKLANLVCKKRGVPLSSKIIDFVKKFKPTAAGGELSEVGAAMDGLIAAVSAARKNVGGSNVDGDD